MNQGFDGMDAVVDAIAQAHPPSVSLIKQKSKIREDETDSDHE